MTVLRLFVEEAGMWLWRHELCKQKVVGWFAISKRRSRLLRLWRLDHKTKTGGDTALGVFAVPVANIGITMSASFWRRTISVGSPPLRAA
jgi:hypothetical protein